MTATPKASERKPPQFRREERRELRHQLSVGIAVALSWTCWLIPGVIRGWIGDRSGDLFFRFSTTYRENVLRNLTQVAGNGDVATLTENNARHVFRTSGRNFLDLIILSRLQRAQLLKSAFLEHGDWSMLDEALATGKGVVLVSAHLGCFDFLGQTLAAKGYKLTVVTGRTTSRFIFDGVTHLRSSNGVSMVEPTPSGVRRVIQALQRGECAVFVTDRDFFQNGLPVEFFGRDTTLPPGAVRIARDQRCPIVPVFTRRVRSGHELAIYPAMTVPRTDDIASDLAGGIARVAAVLEEAISATPEQWVMFQQVWPEEPVEPVRVFPVGSPLESELLERVASALPERRSLAVEDERLQPVRPPTDRRDSPQ